VLRRQKLLAPIKCCFAYPARETASFTRFAKNSMKNVRFGVRNAISVTLKAGKDSSDMVNEKAQKYVGYWLLGCCGLVVGSVSLGGITRLTESGLSMTTWNLIRGMKPPRSEEEWLQEFERYKECPEYKYSKLGMSLEEFKFIFYMEWAHRMWGRFVGLAFFIPAVFFWRKGWFAKGMKPRLLLYGTLLGGQGLLGWYMVKSGLKEETMSLSTQEQPHVSQYRLAAHLGMALVLYSLMFYQGLAHLLKPEKMAAMSEKLLRFKRYSHGVVSLAFFTALSGAFVAGLDAGLTYNSFPKMADRWIPTDLWALEPWYKNLFENPTTTQFNHRILGTTTLAAVVTVWLLARPVPMPYRAKLAVNCLLAVASMQVGLGIATLLTYVPTSLAASHQLGSVSLLSVALWLEREFKMIAK